MIDLTNRVIARVSLSPRRNAVIALISERASNYAPAVHALRAERSCTVSDYWVLRLRGA